MQAASKEYKELMRQKWRNPLAYVRVTIGLINQQAQSTAYVPEPKNYTYFSNLARPMDNYQVTELYCTCDQDYTTVDSSMYFLPRDTESVVLNQGIVTRQPMGPIEIRFPIQYDIKGLTIEFGNAYPVDFTIESDNNTVEITGNAAGHFVTEEIFDGANFLRFTPSRMVNGQCRFRIHMITMGIGIYFDNRKIKSATKKEHISPIMEELPTIDFSLTVNNKDRGFDIENEESTVNFLEIGQAIEVLYGQALDDGTIEWLPGATLYLKEWSADDEEMDFSATDRFDGMDGTYYGGQYRAEGISLYDLAVNVFEDADVDYREYWIDPYLRDVKVCNPMPAVSHKEALQLIANAGRCILYQDRTGNIFLKSSFIPDMSAGSDNETYFSNTGAVLDKTVKKAYVLAAQDYTSVKPAQYFLPKKQTIRYSPNPDGSNMTEERQANSQYIGVGYMPVEIMVNKNLLLNTGFKNVLNNVPVNFGISGDGTMTSSVHDNICDITKTTVPASVRKVFSYNLQSEDISAGTVLTFSLDVLISSDFQDPSNSTSVSLREYTSGNSSSSENAVSISSISTGKWTRLTMTRTISQDKVNRGEIACGLYFGAEAQGTISTRNWKLEIGSSSTDWTPSPSDWVSETNNYEWIPIGEYVKPLYLNTGYTSEEVAGSDGSFSVNPTLVITLEAAFKCFGLTLEFGSNHPEAINFHAYYNDQLMEDYEVSGLSEVTVISHEFPEFDRLELEFTRGIPYNRVVLNNITFGDSTDYVLEYGVELTKTPKGTQLAKVRELQVIRTLYGLSSEAAKELAKETISVSAADNRYTFYFSNPSYELAAAITAAQEGQSVTIIERSAYSATVELTGVTGEVEVTISGKEYVVTQARVSRQLNPTGQLETWENPLVSDVVHAVNLADWIGDYMRADREYDLQYRGEPRLDANDIAFLENKYVPDLLLRVYEHTLKFNGGFSGTIKARRDMGNVAAAKNRLAGK